MEHLRYPDVYIDEPGFLVVLEKDGREVSYFGGYIIDEAEAADGIMFRASQLLQCSMVDPILSTCTARFVCEHGTVHFIYDEEKFSYVVRKGKTADRPV